MKPRAEKNHEVPLCANKTTFACRLQAKVIERRSDMRSIATSKSFRSSPIRY